MMKKLVIALAAAMTMVVAAPAAQASNYTPRENKLWRAVKTIDPVAARYAGKRETVEYGHLACETFDTMGVDAGFLAINVAMLNNFRHDKGGRDWVMVTTVGATYALCRRHKNALGRAIDSM